MNDDTTAAGLWDRTKAWADKNRTISGALVGGAAGTIVPGLGTVIGAIVGAGVGFASSKEKKEEQKRLNSAENLAGDAKGKGTSGSNREAESTDAPEKGELPRSSDEAG